ncbi:MAG TPA: transcriptional regulator CynR [Bordetella sp.]|jgi:LysR family cyn operon transcriptional activator|nr:transcriptional regulator CynR [Bordetella sp.]
MELRHLRYFLAAAQAQNFTLASDRLHITQPTLSHQIKQLEDELGVQLFVRIGRTVHLTVAGELFRTYASRALHEVELGRDALHDLENLRHGRLTLGVLSSFGTFTLPPILADFNATYPGISINVLRLRSGEIERKLLDGELNLAIANAPAGSDQIDIDPLMDDPLAFVVGERHPLAGATRISIGDLRDQALILLSPEYNSRQLIDATFRRHDIQPRIAMEMNAVEPVLSTVRLSKLATILSANLARQWPGLRVVELHPTMMRTVAFFTRHNSILPAAARAFAEAIRLKIRGDKRALKRNRKPR